jgi:hypothetical protein
LLEANSKKRCKNIKNIKNGIPSGACDIYPGAGVVTMVLNPMGSQGALNGLLMGNQVMG